MRVYRPAVGPTRLFSYDPPPPTEPSPKERIRDAALLLCCSRYRCHNAARGRRDRGGFDWAGAAPLSHQAALSAAVDQYVLQVVSEALDATALPEALSDGLDEAGRRLTSLMAEHPDLITYLDAGSPRAAHSDRSSSPDFWASVRPSATSSPGGARPIPTSIPIGRHSTR